MTATRRPVALVTGGIARHRTGHRAGAGGERMDLALGGMRPPPRSRPSSANFGTPAPMSSTWPATSPAHPIGPPSCATEGAFAG